MIVQHGEISHNNHNSNHNKDATTNAIKAVATKSTLMQITRVRAVNGYHLTKIHGGHINVTNNFIFIGIAAY